MLCVCVFGVLSVSVTCLLRSCARLYIYGFKGGFYALSVCCHTRNDRKCNRSAHKSRHETHKHDKELVASAATAAARCHNIF